MSQRNVIILLATVVALVLLVTLGERGSAPSATSGAAFVAGLEAAIDDIERVTVTRAGGETVATIERRPTGWVVTEKGGYPADVAKLRQSLLALAEAQVLEEKTSNPELYARLGVEDVASAEATGVAVAFVAANRELPSLILGNAEGSRYRYVRRTGEAPSYLIDRNPDFPLGASQWLDASIVDVRGERVQQVTITHPDGEVVSVAKAGADAANYDVANVPSGRELLYPGVANVIGNSLRELRLEDVASAAVAVPGEPVVVEFRTFDGLVLEVRGVENGDEHWVTFNASVDAERAAAAAPATPPADAAAEAERINARVGGWRYRIASFQYDQLSRRMSDLLQPPA